MTNEVKIRTEIRAGDIGRLIHYAGVLSHTDYGYPLSFEGYVAKTFAEYLISPHPKNRIWIVEDSENNFVGSIGVIDRGDRAQLRWFNLVPEYRGRGLGRQLFDLAMAHCRECGYPKVFLSTFDDSLVAIGIYERRGFKLIEKKPFSLDGKNLNELIFEKTII